MNLQLSRLTFALILLSVVVVCAASKPQFHDADTKYATKRDCPKCPICTYGNLGWYERLSNCAGRSLKSYILSQGPHINSDFLRNSSLDCMENLLSRVHGQDHLKEPLMKAIANKLAQPEKRLVMHFAGDNGVGKTLLAELVSKALSLKCSEGADGECRTGDALLKIDMTAFHAAVSTPLEGYKHIVPLILAHAAKYPYGVILLDDVNAANPKLVEALAPLLRGATNTFKEAPQVKLAQSTVILTSDFGKEGRARGKSLQELESFVYKETATLYGKRTTSDIQTFAFLPIGLKTAQLIVAGELSMLPCRHTQVLGVSFSTAAMRSIARNVDIVAQNGRAVEQQVREIATSLINFASVRHGMDHHYYANFYWDAEHNKVDMEASDQEMKMDSDGGEL